MTTTTPSPNNKQPRIVYPALSPAAIGKHLLPNNVAVMKPTLGSTPPVTRAVALTSPTVNKPSPTITVSPVNPVIAVRQLTPTTKTTAIAATTQQQKQQLVRIPTQKQQMVRVPIAQPATLVRKRPLVPTPARTSIPQQRLPKPALVRNVGVPPKANTAVQLTARRTIVKQRQYATPPLIDEMRAIIVTPIWEYALPATDAKVSAEQMSMLFDDEFAAAVNTINGEIGRAATTSKGRVAPVA